MPVLDTLALAAMESARALTSDLSPRSDSNNPFGRHCDNGVVLQLRHAPSTRRLGPRHKLTTVPMIIGLPPFFAQSESTWTSIFHLVILRISLRPIVLTSPPSRILLALELTSSLAVLPCPRTSSAGSAFTVPLSIDAHPGHFAVQALTVPHTHKSPSRKKRSIQHAGQWWKEVPARANPARGEHSLLAPGRWPSSTGHFQRDAVDLAKKTGSQCTCLTGTGLIGSVSWCCRDKKLPKRAVLSRVVKLLSGCAHLQIL